MAEQSSIASGGREIATSHNMCDVTQMPAAWYGTGIGGGGGGSGGKTATAQKATAATAATVMGMIPRGDGTWYLLKQVSLMTWAVGEAAFSPLWEDENNFRGEVRVRYKIENVSAFGAFAFVLLLAHCCCCLWAMEPHDVGLHLRAVGEASPQPAVGGRG